MAGTPEYGMPQPATTQQAHVEHKARAEAIAGFVLGLVSVLLSLTPLVGLAAAIVGVILSAKGRRTESRAHGGMATAGIVLSIIGIVLGGLATLVWAAALIGITIEGLPQQLQRQFGPPAAGGGGA